MFQGWGSPRNSRSPRAARSPRASRTYFGFGAAKQQHGSEDGDTKQTDEVEGKSSKRGSFLSGISQSLRSMSPRSARSRSPRQQRSSAESSSASKKGGSAPASGVPSSKAQSSTQITKSAQAAAAPIANAGTVTAASSAKPAAAVSSSSAAAPEEAKYLRPHLRVGDALNGRYEIMHDISTGSFGHVIACKDNQQKGRTVAVKVQDRVEAKYHKGKEGAASCATRDLLMISHATLSIPIFTDFKIEIDILEVVSKRSNRPQSIVEMFEFFEHMNRWCIAFETLGPSL